MILFTLHIRNVIIRLIASHGLLGPLATVEATIGAKDRIMTAPSNTWREISFFKPFLTIITLPFLLGVLKGSHFAPNKCNCGTYLKGIREGAKPQKGCIFFRQHNRIP